MRGELFGAEHAAEVGPAGSARLAVQKHNRRVIRARIEEDSAILARYGTIIASSGELEFSAHGQGFENLARRVVTGEGVAVMEISGTGEVWLGDGGHAAVVDIEPGDWLSIAGPYLVAWTPELRYEIRAVRGAALLATGVGGLMNCLFTADETAGRLAISASAQPLTLPVTPDRPLFVDPDRVIGWAPQLHAEIRRARDLGWAVRGGGLLQFVFTAEDDGDGFVIVSPAGTGAPGSGSGSGSGGSPVGNAVGNVAGDVAGGFLGH